MASSAWQLYDGFMLEKSNGTQDLENDVFSVVLMTVAYTPSLSADLLWSAISTNQVSLVNGYDGPAVSVQTLTGSSGNVNFTLTDVSWLAAGGSIVSHYALIKNDTTGGLVGYCQLDITPDDVTIADGKTLAVDFTNTVFDEARV